MLQELITLLNAMKDGSEHHEGWSKLEPLIGLNGLVTLSWPQWRLKIVTFKMPKEWDGTPDSAEAIEAMDNLYWDKDGKIIWKTYANENTVDWSKLTRCTAVDVVDAFLSGSWTPPWKCGFCVSRHKGQIQPRF
jgi:hypothetical protein